MRDLLFLLLRAHGWQVTTAGDGLTALQCIEAASFDGVLADLRIPGPDGIRVLEHARLLNPGARLVLYGGFLTQAAKDRATEINAACVRKGATESVALLLTALEDANA